ncbi:MAG: CapA family protein [Faecalibacterium sp.]
MEKHSAAPPPRRRRHTQNKASYLMPVLGVVLAACVSLLCLGVWKIPHTTGTPLPTAPELLPESTVLPPGPAPEPEPEPEPEPVVSTISFSASGDNLIHSPIYKQAARRAGEGERYNFDACYENLAPLYAQQDVNWINQETLCSTELEPSTYPCFSTPGECAESLYRAGIRVFSLANNHTYDKGAKGIAATQRFWDSMPEDVLTTGLWSGESDYGRIPLQTVNDVTIAYLSYTDHTNGIPRSSSMTANIIYTNETAVIEQQVRTARQLADFVVVGVHWGTEDSHTINAGQQTLAQQLADWGADVIIGTHPHVVQDAAWLTAADGRETFVAYSLGNLISTQSKPDQVVGAILTLTLKKTTDPDGTVHRAVLSPKLHPTVTHYDAGKSNVRTYLYRNYTPELAQKHGVRTEYSSFGYDFIRECVQKNISEEFLELA